MAPLPGKPLDPWLGGRIPVAMQRVGRLADGWLGSFITPDEAAECRARIVRAAAEAGREIEEDHYGTNLLVAPDGADERDLDASVARAAGRRPELTDPGTLICRGWAAARDELRRFVDAGLTKFVVRPAAPVGSPRDFLDQFGAELAALQT